MYHKQSSTFKQIRVIHRHCPSNTFLVILKVPFNFSMSFHTKTTLSPESNLEPRFILRYNCFRSKTLISPSSLSSFLYKNGVGFFYSFSLFLPLHLPSTSASPPSPLYSPLLFRLSPRHNNGNIRNEVNQKCTRIRVKCLLTYIKVSTHYKGSRLFPKKKQNKNYDSIKEKDYKL